MATTNPPFGEWTRIVTDARLREAVADRLTFGAHTLESGTDSRHRRRLVRARKDPRARSVGKSRP